MKETALQVKKMLNEIGIPITYHSFKSEKDLPFGVFLNTERRDFKADNINYHEVFVFDFEVYTSNAKYDFELQDKIERVFKKHDIFYDFIHVEIPENRMHQMLFTFTIRKGELEEYE